MKNKFLFISFVLLFFILIFSSQCFAVDVNILPEGMYDAMTSDDKNAILNCSYYCILTCSDGGYIITSDVPITVIKTLNSTTNIYNYKFAVEKNGSGIYKSFYYNSDTNIYDFSSDSLVSGNLLAQTSSLYKLTVDSSIYTISESNQILSDTETGEVFYSPSFDEPPVDDDTSKEENIIVDINTIHTDLGVICSILIFFVLVILLKYAYKFFNMFFTI